jgi:TonB-dependent SusC/RagA subfamily outer membrane receptor
MKIPLLKGFLLVVTFLCFGLAKAQTVSGTDSDETDSSTAVDEIKSVTPAGVPKLNMRGFGLSGNNDPVYIIDGVQIDDKSGLNYVNPSNIEQITVLKDCATAICGHSATNGVIVITTNGEGYHHRDI